jgi:CheY-like chemotaxis protein
VITGKGEPNDLFSAAAEEGMGVGWFTLLKNVAELGGRVTLTSRQGFTFALELPRAGEDAVEKPSAGICFSGAAPEVRQGTALVIDDEEITGKVTAEMLDYLGFETVLTADPAAALPILKERRFELVMVDYLMPGLNGDVFIRKYSSLLKDSHVVLMTGDHTVSLPQAVGSGRVDLLKKPFGLKELACLAEQVDSRTDPEKY